MSDALIPVEWLITNLGEICSKITDGSHNPPKPKSDGLPMLSAKNVQRGSIDFSKGYRLISLDEFELEDKRTKISVDDILLTIVGTLGRTAQVMESTPKFTLQRSVSVLAAPLVDPAYFRFSLDEPSFQLQIFENAKGTAQKGIYLKKLRVLELNLPPFAEQKEIAVRLDDLLAQVDSIKTRLDGLPVLLKRFRQSTLAAATSGKLTEQWRVEPENITYDNWRDLTLSHVARWGSGGTPSRSNKSYFMGHIPWVKTGDLGPKVLLEATEFITQEAVDKSSAKLFSKGSVIIAMYGATIGKTSILGIDATTNQACAVGFPNPSLITTDYLYYLLTSEKKAFIKKGKGGAQPNISQTVIKAHEITIPTVKEQIEIVRRVEELFAFADQVELRVKDAQAQVKHLTQSILAKAFRGELTADWRANNPDLITGENSAAALLERIKSERKKLKPKKKTRKK